MSRPSSPQHSGGGALGPLGGLVAGAAFNLAVEAVKGWNDERISRRAINQVFWSECLDAANNLRLEDRCGVIAGLKFEVFEVLRKDWTADEYYEVKVTNEQYPGDDRRRVRTFRYFVGSKAGWISWPPYFSGASPKR